MRPTLRSGVGAEIWAFFGVSTAFFGVVSFADLRLTLDAADDKKLREDDGAGLGAILGRRPLVTKG